MALLLFINFTFTACDENKNSSTESVDKTGTSFLKADLTELINKIGDRDLKLIELIKNNPVSKFKTTLYQKTKTSSSEYYFDTDNIMAVKNETNQAVYIIPAYKSSNSRDNNIYSISINITDDFIDTKLNILQLKENGTQESISYDFVYSTSASKVKDIECYCTVTVSDCTCHTTHAPSGCDHPIISYTECSCSGGTSFGTATGSNAGATVISNIWASSGGGTNYGYAYNYSGQEAYIGLTKKFPFQYFNEFQRVAITTNPEISNLLLEFLDTDGNSQMNKDFVVSVINAIEEGSVTTYEQSLVLLSTYKTVQIALKIESQIDDSLLDPCSKGIMEQLKKATNSDIANVMTKLGAKNEYSTTMKMGTVAPGKYAATTKVSKNNYLVTVTQNDFTTASKLYKATALLHEIIHAYMLSVVDDYNTYPTNAPFTNFPELFKIYVSKINNVQDADLAQHEDMADKYVNAIASALEEYQTSTTGIPSTLADKQVFLDLAWSGLQGTDIYNKKSQEGIIDNTRITARIGAEQNGVYSQGQYAVGKQCN